MKKTKLETLSHYAVIVIALLAFVLSILQTRIQHKHNKLSVRPILNAIIEQSDSTMAAYINNKGVGPAIIKEASFSFDGKTYDDIEKLLRESGLIKIRLGGYTLNPDAVISADEDRLLVRLKGRDIKGVKVNLTYESVYEEQYDMSFSF